MTSPITRLPPNGLALTDTISISLHSMLTRDSATRGARTRSLGVGVNPETTNSSISGGNSGAVRFILAAKSSETMFTTNSRVAATLRSVSFCALSLPRTMGEKQIAGGLALMAVKKLNAARFRMPSVETVDTKAIGRGTIAPIKSL